MSNVAAATLGPDSIQIRQFPRPPVQEGDMLVQIEQVGICGSDKHMYVGHAKLEFPVVPGHEMVGRIIEMGPEAQTTSQVVGGPLAIGDRVCVTPSSQGCGRCWFCRNVPHRPALCPNRTVYGFTAARKPPHLHGALAELMLVGPRSNVFRVPDELPSDRAVLTEPAAVATRAVQRALGPGIPHIGEGLSIGTRVAVLGAGPIGLLIVVALRYMGAGTIIVSDRSTTRLQLARRLGAQIALNVQAMEPQDRLDAARDATDGVGPDVVIEAAGVPAAFQEALSMVRRGGRVVEVGHYFDSGSVDVAPHTICHKDVDVLGCWSYPPMQFQIAMSMLAATSAPLEMLLTATMPLARTADAVRMTGDAEIIKVVVEPGS